MKADTTKIQSLKKSQPSHIPSLGRNGLQVAVFAAMSLSVSSHAAMLEEVTVTAQKRSESVQDVPISVAVVGGDQISNSGMNDMMDLSASIPNVHISDGVNSQHIFIRGIGSGIDRGLEQSIGMFIDGIYMGRSRQYKAPFLDIDRVEVLRGPQAVLFGKNTVGGAVKVETRKAELGELTALVLAEYEFEYGDTRLTGVVNTPISDTFAVRFSASTTQKEGYFDDTWKNRDELEVDEDVFRLSATWAASENLTVYGKLDYAKSDTVGSLPSEISFFDESFPDPIAQFFIGLSKSLDPQLNDRLDYKKSTRDTNDIRNEKERQDDEIWGGMIHFDYQWGEHTLTAITGYSEYESDEWQDTDFLPMDLLGQNNHEEFDQISQEIRLVSPGGETIDYIVGAYWQENNLDLPYDTAFEMSTLAPVLAQLDPSLPVLPWVNRVTNYELNTESWSVFAEATWNVTENLKISFGGRYSEEEKEVSSYSWWADFNDQVIPDDFSTLESIAAYGVLGGALGVVATAPGEDKRDESHFSPSLKISWYPTEDIMAYGSAQRGYKSGGFNSAGDVRAPVSEFEYEEEEVTGYEIGMKTTLLDGAANFNIAYFYTEFDDLQVTSFVGSTFILSNAGSSVSQGVEMDGKWAITDDLTLSGSLAWLDSEYDEYPTGPCTIAQIIVEGNACKQDLSGETTTYAPDWSASVNADYLTSISDSLDLGLNVQVIYSDEFYLDGDLDSNALQDSYTKVNARISIGSVDGTWEMALAGNNLTDETTAGFGSDVPLVSGSFFAMVEAPRTVALQARYNF